jgi:flagellar biosynthesis GTPase FlhF
MTNKPSALVRIEYEEAAEAYLRGLPPEHFMEAVSQATQRKIFVESADLVSAHNPAVQAFNELLVQERGPDGVLLQVVPDNMVVVCEQPIQAKGSYDVPFQPARPFWVLEYVSKYTKRKDYEDNFTRYEQRLKVPYYLIFYPDGQDLSLYRLVDGRYVSVLPNEAGRHALPELDIEVALLDGWVRFWFRGELLPLPADLQRELLAVRRQVQDLQRQLTEEQRRAGQEAQRAIEAMHRASQAAQYAAQEAQRAAQEAQRADEATQRATEATQRAAQEAQRADAATQHAAQETRRADAALQRAEQSERELAQLREELARLRRS